MVLLLQYTLIFSSVLILVALGGCFAEHSGVINLGLEGIMVLGALGGVNTNELLQVVDSTNTPISGLYATGNNVSGMSVAAYVNIEGTGLGFALTSGRHAGANASAASK